MKNFVLKWTLLVALVFTVHASALAEAATKVLILPYQVNGGADKASLKQDVPNLVAERLRNAGMTVVSKAEVDALLKAQNVQDVDIITARQLGEAAGASAVVYGVYNQLGDGFSLDSRIVPISSSRTPDVVTLEKGSMLELAGAADQLAARVSSTVGAASAPARTKQQMPQIAKGPIKKGALSEVKVEGLRIMDADAVLMRLSIGRGDMPDEMAINEEVKRIWDMGYFSDVQARMDPGQVLVFSVVEKPKIDSIQVEGSDEIDEDDIMAAMGTKVGSVLNDRMLADDLQKVTDLYRKEGYYLADVKHQVIPRDNGAGARLVLTVVEGDELYISEVNIAGLNELDQSDIEDYMALQPRSIISWITGTGVLEEEYLERDTNAIAAYGLNEGFVDIQVAAPEVDYTPDGIIITFNVSEGRRYKVSDVKFGGELIEDEDKLLAIVEMDDHQADTGYFSLSVMQEDATRLKEFYGDQGYAFADVDPKVLKAENGDATVSIGYFVNKKQKVYIRRVDLEGNSKTRDNVLLREMRLADGDMYEGAKLRRSTERLNRLGYFESVDVDLVPTGSPEEVDLKVKVKEANTGAIMAGIGYSTYYDVGVSASIQERNLFGRGYWLQVQGFTSWRRTSGIISFTNPRVYDTDLLIGNDLYYTYDYWDDFTKDTFGDTIRFSYPIGEYTSVGMGYRLERYNLTDVDVDAAPSIRDYKGINWTSAISARITRDTTDSRTHPTKGTITRLWTEYGGGGLGGTDNFVKAMFDWQGFYSLDKKSNHVFHIRGRVGGVFENTDNLVPVFERFYIGGIDTIRGFDYTHISPRDQTHGDRIGGDRMGVLNVEYIWNFQEDLGLALVPFVDSGFNIDSSYMDVYDHIVATAGLELRWRSPMGDLRVAYGIPLTDDYDGKRRQGRFEFTMGQQF